jgi:hypothetical protein
MRDEGQRAKFRPASSTAEGRACVMGQWHRLYVMCVCAGAGKLRGGGGGGGRGARGDQLISPPTSTWPHLQPALDRTSNQHLVQVHNLDPAIDRRAWTEHEDAFVISMHEIVGSQW